MTDPQPDPSPVAYLPLTQGSEVGPYRLIRELGVGGMGQVFLAEDSRLQRRVALKFLAPQHAVKEDFRQRFIREARSAAKLSHQNVVTVFEVDESSGHAYISMEYISGRSLRELIDTRALNYEQSLKVFEQLCEGLKKAHSAGLVHRDLKPANVMLTEDQQVKILDFGLAKGALDDNLTNSGAALGTVNYMSPEQATGSEIDQRSDIFSAGIVLFELLAGINPFVRGYMPATIHAIVYESVDQLSAYDDTLKPDWQIIIEKALAKDASDRYQTIDELVQDIALLKAGKRITPGAAAQPKVSRSDKASLAVLHLKNLGSEDDDFLTYGITEDLIIDLSKLGSVKLTPMRKVLKYKDSDLELEDLARNLNVNLVLDGSIQRSKSGIRIGAQLIDVERDEILWSERWEESVDNLPKVKSALAHGVSSALGLDSSVVRKADAVRAETSNPEAYNLYLEAKYTFQKRKSKKDTQRAIELYEKTLELSPNMLSARVGIAEIHSVEFELVKAQEILEPALKEAREKGLKADEARVLTVLGSVANRQRNEKQSIEHLEAAVKLFRELNDINGEAWAMSELFKPYSNISQGEEVLRREQRFSELMGLGVDPKHIVQGVLVLANAYGQMDNLVKEIEYYQDALQLARANQLDEFAAWALARSATVIRAQGGHMLPTALSYLEEARLIAEKLDSRQLLINVSFRLAGFDADTGAFKKFLSVSEELEASLESINDTLGIASSHANKGYVYYFVGDFEECFKIADTLHNSAQRLSGAFKIEFDGFAHSIRALGCFGLGKFEEAEEAMRRSIEDVKRSGLEYNLPILEATLGEMQYLVGQHEKALAMFGSALEHGDVAGDLQAEIIPKAYLTFERAKHGALDSVRKELLTLVEKSEGHWVEVTARRLYGQALLEHGANDKDRETGKRELLQALGMSRKMEFAVERDRITEILERN